VFGWVVPSRNCANPGNVPAPDGVYGGTRRTAMRKFGKLLLDLGFLLFWLLMAFLLLGALLPSQHPYGP